MDFKTAFNKSAALCARQERCSFEIEEKLLIWEVDRDIIDQVIKTLIEEKYIDENRFAGFYARDKFRFNKWGKQKIAFQLRQKRIAQDVINEVLEGLDDNDYGDTLLLLLKAKERSLTIGDAYKKKAALIRFAVSRGFEYDQIMKTLDFVL
jgi:regulatory protein